MVFVRIKNQIYMDEHSNNQALTEHMVLTKTRANSLSDVKTLNMWGFNLKDISLFERMPNIEICSLPVNKINNLAPLANCRKLRELYLRQNDISDFHEITYLSGLRFLKNLSLSDNPIASSPNYRQTVFQILPQLEKLDEIERNQIPQQQPQKNISDNYKRSNSTMDNQYSTKNTSFSQTLQHSKQPIYDNEYNSSSNNNHTNFHHQMHPPQHQTMRPRHSYSNTNNFNSYSNNNAGRSDERALTAVLALLPELSPESLAIVVQTIADLQNDSQL